MYVPLGIGAVKAGFDNTVIRPLVERGLSIQYSLRPEYQGVSSVPIALTIEWAKPGDTESSTLTINVWGEALTRGGDA